MLEISREDEIPSKTPMTWKPLLMASIVTAEMTPLTPGAGSPPHRITSTSLRISMFLPR